MLPSVMSEGVVTFVTKNPALIQAAHRISGMDLEARNKSRVCRMSIWTVVVKVGNRKPEDQDMG